MEREESAIFDQFTAGKTASPGSIPQFVVFYGPPASGKGYLTDFVNQKLRMSDNHTIDLNVDEVIEKFTSYQNRIRKCKALFATADLPNVEEHIVLACQKIYIDHRERGGALVDKMLDYALENHIDVRFETTGGHVGWLSSLLDRIKGKYVRIVVYPVVASELILSRMFERAKRSGRLPDPSKIMEMIDRAQTNLSELQQHSDRLIVVDNNEAGRGRVVADIVHTCKLGSDFLNLLNRHMRSHLLSMCQATSS
jgi:adenylate kinase family enzyme